MKQDEQEAGITFLSLPNPTFFFFQKRNLTFGILFEMLSFSTKLAKSGIKTELPFPL